MEIELVKENKLTEEEQAKFKFHTLEIEKAMRSGQAARRNVIINVLEILDNELWRESFNSPEDYVRTELNLEVSSFSREVKATKNYLFLVANTDDPDEQITLTRMTPFAFRELRRLATDNKKVLKKGGQDDEEYKQLLQEKEDEDSKLILDLWKEVYPRIAKYRETSKHGKFPNGGYAVSSTDILETSALIAKAYEIPKLLASGVNPSDIEVGTLGGEAMSLQDVIQESGEDTIEAIESFTDSAVAENLSEKFARRNDHINESLEQSYQYDKIRGKLLYTDGKLIIENQYGKFNLVELWADLLGVDTIVSIRRGYGLSGSASVL